MDRVTVDTLQLPDDLLSVAGIAKCRCANNFAGITTLGVGEVLETGQDLGQLADR